MRSQISNPAFEISRSSAFGAASVLLLCLAAAASPTTLPTRFAGAQPAGTVELGAAASCQLYKLEDRWLAAAWSQREPLPLPSELLSAKAWNSAGEEVQPKTITSAPTYFELAQLPHDWDGQRVVSWASPSLATVPGSPVIARITAPNIATVAEWIGMSPKIAATPWKRDGESLLSTLTPADDLWLGDVPLRVQARGPDWRRHWNPVLKILTPVAVTSAPWSAGRKLPIRLSSNGPAVEVQLDVPATRGHLSADSATLANESFVIVDFEPELVARGPIPLRIHLPNAREQIHWLRPAALDIPRVDKVDPAAVIDTALQRCRLDARFFQMTGRDLPVEVFLGWTPHGLWLAARLPLDLEQKSPPEVWCDLAPLDGNAREHVQIRPVRDGEKWRLTLVAGGKDLPAQSFTQSADESLVLKTLLPLQDLAAGSQWRAAVGARFPDAAECAWPAMPVQNEPPAGTLRLQ